MCVCEYAWFFSKKREAKRESHTHTHTLDAPIQGRNKFRVVRQVCVHQHDKGTPDELQAIHVGTSQAQFAWPLVDLDLVGAVDCLFFTCVCACGWMCEDEREGGREERMYVCVCVLTCNCCATLEGAIGTVVFDDDHLVGELAVLLLLCV